jgi:phosphoribosylformylglycinamidine cyclo-ligase
MGHRMEIYIDNKYANEIIEISNKFGVDAKIIGRVLNSETKKLSITNKFGTYTY